MPPGKTGRRSFLCGKGKAVFSLHQFPFKGIHAENGFAACGGGYAAVRFSLCSFIRYRHRALGRFHAARHSAEFRHRLWAYHQFRITAGAFGLFDSQQVFKEVGNRRAKHRVAMRTASVAVPVFVEGGGTVSSPVLVPLCSSFVRISTASSASPFSNRVRISTSVAKIPVSKYPSFR